MLSPSEKCTHLSFCQSKVLSFGRLIASLLNPLMYRLQTTWEATVGFAFNKKRFYFYRMTNAFCLFRVRSAFAHLLRNTHSDSLKSNSVNESIIVSVLQTEISKNHSERSHLYDCNQSRFAIIELIDLFAFRSFVFASEIRVAEHSPRNKTPIFMLRSGGKFTD